MLEVVIGVGGGSAGLMIALRTAKAARRDLDLVAYRYSDWIAYRPEWMLPKASTPDTSRISRGKQACVLQGRPWPVHPRVQGSAHARPTPARRQV